MKTVNSGTLENFETPCVGAGTLCLQLKKKNNLLSACLCLCARRSTNRIITDAQARAEAILCAPRLGAAGKGGQLAARGVLGVGPMAGNNVANKWKVGCTPLYSE
jgi:hypothetical protein